MLKEIIELTQECERMIFDNDSSTFNYNETTTVNNIQYQSITVNYSQLQLITVNNSQL